ncbi:hypothetical protein [Demequina sp. NBRC 110057]|uniref:hypothetical protein n=1 Tax=Demequina sp. NBRC 110057 TaxID=1570346 RepID=UPI000A07452A|nr:hypothetical protein [Demequina sp. NBRC 110057]
MSLAPAREPTGPVDAATLTVLAWRRTALRVAVGAVVAARLLTSEFGGAVVVAGLVGVAIALTVHASASAAYLRIVKRASRGESPGGIARPGIRIGALAGFTLAVGLAGLAWVALQAGG